MNRLGTPFRVERPWSDEEKKTVRDKYRELGPTKLAEMLARSVNSVAAFARRCGLQRSWRDRYETT